MNKRLVIMSVLFVMVFVNAIAVIYVKQQSRGLYSDIRALQKQQDSLTIDWGRLQLQNSTLTNAAYVEQVATRELGMRTVSQPHYVVLP